jgi:hypothetical protein
VLILGFNYGHRGPPAAFLQGADHVVKIPYHCSSCRKARRSVSQKTEKQLPSQNFSF